MQNHTAYFPPFAIRWFGPSYAGHALTAFLGGKRVWQVGAWFRSMSHGICSRLTISLFLPGITKALKSFTWLPW